MLNTFDPELKYVLPVSSQFDIADVNEDHFTLVKTAVFVLWLWNMPLLVMRRWRPPRQFGQYRAPLRAIVWEVQAGGDSHIV